MLRSTVGRDRKDLKYWRQNNVSCFKPCQSTGVGRELSPVLCQPCLRNFLPNVIVSIHKSLINALRCCGLPRAHFCGLHQSYGHQSRATTLLVPQFFTPFLCSPSNYQLSCFCPCFLSHISVSGNLPLKFQYQCLFGMMRKFWWWVAVIAVQHWECT